MISADQRDEIERQWSGRNDVEKAHSQQWRDTRYALNRWTSRVLDKVEEWKDEVGFPQASGRNRAEDGAQSACNLSDIDWQRCLSIVRLLAGLTTTLHTSTELNESSVASSINPFPVVVEQFGFPRDLRDEVETLQHCWQVAEELAVTSRQQRDILRNDSMPEATIQAGNTTSQDTPSSVSRETSSIVLLQQLLAAHEGMEHRLADIIKGQSGKNRLHAAKASSTNDHPQPTPLVDFAFDVFGFEFHIALRSRLIATMTPQVIQGCVVALGLICLSGFILIVIMLDRQYSVSSNSNEL